MNIFNMYMHIYVYTICVCVMCICTYVHTHVYNLCYHVISLDLRNTGLLLLPGTQDHS